MIRYTMSKIEVFFPFIILNNKNMKKENKILKYAIGIDVAKEWLDVCFVKLTDCFNTKVVASRKFKNNLSGFELLNTWVKNRVKDSKIPLVFNFEASGVYHENLAFYLSSKKEKLSIILPNKSKRYLQSLGYKSKNDKIDAKGLGEMAAQQNLKLWQPATKFYYQLRLLTRHHQSIQETKTVLTNRLEALKHSAHNTTTVISSLQRQFKLLVKELAKVKTQIRKHVSKNAVVSEKVENICRIKGLDILTVATVLAETFGFELFENNKQLISYSGYDIVENQSGKRSGKTKISKKGNSRIRRILHMPAFSVKRYKQTAFYNLYNRSFERHGIKMKSYVAIQKKLLTTIYALWKKNEAYDNLYHLKCETENQTTSVTKKHNCDHQKDNETSKFKPTTHAKKI